ncbi:MAG: hypothetical protein RL076_2230 [Chloroflexota bacterium]
MQHSTPQKIIPVTRREIGAGLAFAEEYDLQRLSQWAAEGWRLAKIEHLWMVLEQAPPEQVIFAIDYQDAPDSDYFEMCRVAGWQHVTSVEQQIHLFKAAPGTAAIFSPADATTKYQRAARMFAKPALWSSIGVAVSLALLFGVVVPWVEMQESILVRAVEIVALIIVCVLATISIFTVLPWLSYRLRLTGIQVRMSRLMFGLIFGLCGAVLGYFIGSMIP